MYVDVVACRRGRVKVDVTVAKRVSGRPVLHVVGIPARAAGMRAEEGMPSNQAQPSTAAELFAPAEAVSASEPVLLCDQNTESDEKIAAEAFSEIDEMLAGMQQTDSVDELEDVVSGALDELDGMSLRTDDIMERINGEVAEALDELSGSADENSELLSSTIRECLDSVDSLHAARPEEDEEKKESASEPEKALPEEALPRELTQCLSEEDSTAAVPVGAEDYENIEAPDKGAYMRYFERDDQGGRIQVSSDSARGQEVVCYDGSSGRLSRVCGIIKKNSDSYTGENGIPENFEA